MSSPAHDPRDNLSRIKRPSPLGTTVFVGLRMLDPLLQHAILAHNVGSALITRLGGRIIPQGAPISDVIALSPYRLVLLSMAAGGAFKQIFWLLTVSQEEMPVKSAIAISAINIILNSANSLLFLCAATTTVRGRAENLSDPGFPSIPLARKRFKKDPRNKGKNYTGGLFSLARHINYGGFTLWRTGYALASGGWIWGGVVGALFFYDFATRGVPVLDDYCQAKYGEAWSAYKNKVSFKLFPGLY
ncbi:hypothetical protein Hypma_006743 [Hypsizygus marmoreus]|uniref:Steroid 5-alpha reductase C-terminal domain-containing protein n=1 Tax=Hypsizygus marmoreus TaxID=39966 RepID=A0A369JVI0_HYPMA|nr:hypothetical protein Hypma_006743 [Hypsizygus marmoreus]